MQQSMIVILVMADFFISAVLCLNFSLGYDTILKGRTNLNVWRRDNYVRCKKVGMDKRAKQL